MSYGVLVGDAQGRVNLLLLLVVFAFLPVVGLLLSVVLLLKGGGTGLAGWVLEAPLWPARWTRVLPQLGIYHSRKLWLFYQTQILSLGFSAGCILLYLLLLLGSDISFVWRSTLLEPQDLLPVLRTIAVPWAFWSEAQVSMTLIEQTQNFRLDNADSTQSVVGLWWQYLLAAQICYNLLPRSIMLLIARALYLKRLQAGTPEVTRDSVILHSKRASDFQLADLVTTITQPYMLLDWAIAPASCHAQIQHQLGAAHSVSQIGPLTEPAGAIGDNAMARVVLVKSWEPPMSELSDSLSGMQASADRVLLPLDWNESGMLPPAAAHLAEWRRFAATLPGWQVLQLPASDQVSQ